MFKSGFLKNTLASAVVASGVFAPVSKAVAEPPVSHASGTFSSQYTYPEAHQLAPHSDEDVDVRLVLVVDASSSMKAEEYKIQIDVMVAALTSENVQNAWFGVGPQRNTGPIDSIAIAVVDFGNWADLRLPWVDFRADDPNLEARFEAFGTELTGLIEGRDYRKDCCTQIAGMLNYSARVFANAPWEAKQRSILDVISDGKGTASNIEPARKALSAQGVTINALAIANEYPQLDTYFRNTLVTQWEDIPPRSNVLPGRVWAIARTMQESDNTVAALRSFEDEAEEAFYQKIVWETVLLDVAPVDERASLESGQTGHRLASAASPARLEP